MQTYIKTPFSHLTTLNESVIKIFTVKSPLYTHYTEAQDKMLANAS